MTRKDDDKPHLPKFKRNIGQETVEIAGVKVKFWRWKGRWFWGVSEPAQVRLQDHRPKA